MVSVRFLHIFCTIFQAILTGDVVRYASTLGMSPSQRLKQFKESEQDNTEEARQAKFSEWKKRMTKLVKFVDSGKYPDLRLDEDADLFRTFVEFCLVHFIKYTTWRYKCYNTPVSDIFTVSDEAMAMLLLENSVDDLKYVIRRGQKVPTKASMPRYTKVNEGSNEKFRGWHKNGIKRYNKFYRRIVANRLKRESMEKEDAILSKFVKISGKDEGCNNVTVIDYSDDDSDGGIELIDGFVGDKERSVNSDIQAVNTENALHEGVALDDDTTT